mgnify:CR=1 FL=1
MGIYTDNPDGSNTPPRYPRPTEGIYNYRRPDGSDYTQFGSSCEICGLTGKAKYDGLKTKCAEANKDCGKEIAEKLNCNCSQVWSEPILDYVWKLSCTLPGGGGECGAFPTGGEGEFSSQSRCQLEIMKIVMDPTNPWTEAGVWIYDCCGWKMGLSWAANPATGQLGSSNPDSCLAHVQKLYEERIIPEWADCVNNAADGWGGNYEPPPCGKWNPPGLPGGVGGQTTWPPPPPPVNW